MKLNKSVGEIMSRFGRRWDLIEKLYERPYGLTELSRELDKKDSQVLREINELTDVGIVERVGKGRERKYMLKKDFKAIADFVLQNLQTEEKPKPKLTDLSDEEWERLKESLTSPKYEEERKLALYKFVRICEKKRAWKVRDILEFLKEHRSEEIDLNGKIRMLSLIRTVIQNAKNEDGFEAVKSVFLPTFLEEFDGEQWRNAWGTLSLLLPEEELIELAKKKCLSAFKLFRSEKQNKEMWEVLNHFKSFFKEHLNRIEPWFDELVRDEDERVRKGALLYYNELISG